MSVTAILANIHCVATSEANLDELYFTYVIDGGEPVRVPDAPGSFHQIGAGGDWRVYQAFTFERSLTIALWEADGAIGGNEQLGHATYAPDDLPAETTLRGGNAEYRLVLTRA